MEIIIVISIFGLLVTLSLPTYNSIKDNIALKNDGNELVNTLRLAQGKSINSFDGARHGVYLNNSEYILYSGDWPTPLSQVKFAFKNGVEVLSGVGTAIAFDRLTGEAVAATIVIGTSDEAKRTIEINPAGRINLK